MSDMKISIDNILKNALHWKQWMADDLRILLDTSRNENLSDKALHRLIMHHLKTYTLVNQSFSYMIDSPDTDLFELPNLDYLKEILPGLDLDENDVEKVIEPMLELELDGLSKELREETLHPTEKILDDLGVEDIEIFVENDELDFIEDEDDLEDDDSDLLDELGLIDDDEDDDSEDFDEDDEPEDDFDEEIPKIVDIPESRVETKDLIGKLWDDMAIDDVKLGLNKGDADIGDGN